jgi:hypothetical protein
VRDGGEQERQREQRQPAQRVVPGEQQSAVDAVGEPPDAIVPTTSKTPTRASRPAAVVVCIPWSCAAGTKWVAMSPLVLAPQMAKPAASNQKAGVCEARRRAATAATAAPPGGGADGATGSGPPYGSRPTSAGRSASSSSTSGTTARAAPATTSAAVRQPERSASTATSGRKTSCPVALPAVRMPVTSPRDRVNHRLATVAAKTSAIEPVPRPTSTPQHRTSCQLAVMKTVSPLPAATTHSAVATTRRMPNCSMSAAANGAVSPNSSRLTLTARETVAVDQPNSSCSGRISTPGVARKPAEATSATKATPATHHARWTRRPVAIGAVGAVTGAV